MSDTPNLYSIKGKKSQYKDTREGSGEWLSSYFTEKEILNRIAKLTEEVIELRSINREMIKTLQKMKVQVDLLEHRQESQKES